MSKTLDIHAAAIIRAAKANPNITVASLLDELERGDINGWMAIVQRHRMTFAQWSGAMRRAINALDKARTDSFIGRTIVHMGRVWRVIGVGAVRDGNTFCHLASVYEFRMQKNGRVPLQINDWVDTAVLAAAKEA